MVKNYQKISSTAIFCARMRAKHNIPFAKEIVKIIDTKYSKWIKDLPDYGNTLNAKSDFIPFIEGRYYCLNDAINKIDNAFIVEIASGLSPRSLEFSNKKDIVYVETELDGLIDLKKRILVAIIKKKKLSDKNLIFMAVNPLKKKDMNKIGKLYLEKGKNKQLLIIHEGLLMYFDKNDKNIFRNNVKYLFETYAKKGLWLTPDFSRIKTKIGEPKGKENIRDKITKITKRKFSYFESRQKTREFLKNGGFKSEILPNGKVVSNLIEQKSLQYNKNEILKSSKEYQIWKMQLS